MLINNQSIKGPLFRLLTLSISLCRKPTLYFANLESGVYLNSCKFVIISGVILVNRWGSQ